MSTNLNTETADIPALLRRANAAARVGDLAAARAAFEQVLAARPESTEALLGLAGVAQSREQKRDYFEQVLALDPSNADAREGLELIGAQPTAMAVLAETPEILYCANHPNVETRLRCNKCNKPICVRCGSLTPVGYRCRECIRGQQAVFYSSRPADLVIAAGISLVLGTIAAAIIPAVGWFIAIFVSPMAGGGIAELVHRAIGRRRGQYTWLAVAIGLLGGAILAQAPGLFGALLGARFGGPFFGFNWLGVGLYLVLAIGAAISRLRFGR